MRARLQVAKPAKGALEAKNGAGRLMDIELLAQMCALVAGSPARSVERQIAAGGKAQILSVSDMSLLLDAYRLLWRLQAGTRLLTDRALDLAALGEGGRAFLLRETGEADAAALERRVEAVTTLAAGVVSAHVGAGGA